MTLPTRTAITTTTIRRRLSFLPLTNITTFALLSTRSFSFSFLLSEEERREGGRWRRRRRDNRGLIEYRGRDIGHVIVSASLLLLIVFSSSILPFFPHLLTALKQSLKQIGQISCVTYRCIDVCVCTSPMCVCTLVHDRAPICKRVVLLTRILLTRPNID